MFSFDTSVIIKALPVLMEGIKITLFISVISSVAAFIIGVFLVFFRTMGSSPLKFFAVSYIEVIRNTPLLIQLYFVYKALPSFGMMLPPIACGIISLSIYTGAFIAEVLRSGIKAVASEQYQASISLGLTNFKHSG